jgi:hypothetical protein
MSSYRQSTRGGTPLCVLSGGCFISFCSLFNDAVSSSDYIASNDMVINE